MNEIATHTKEKGPSIERKRYMQKQRYANLEHSKNTMVWLKYRVYAREWLSQGHFNL